MYEANTAIGLGVYRINEASRLLKIDDSTLRRWAFGDAGSCKESKPILGPGQLADFTDERLISFSELIELRFIGVFRKLGVSLETIRKASQHAAQLFNTKYPFTHRRFQTDGRNIFAELSIAESDDKHIQNLRSQQYVLGILVENTFKNLDFDESDLVSRFTPYEATKGVVLDPKRSFGQPVLVDCGLPTSTVYRMVMSDESPEGVSKWFDISLDSVKQAVVFESWLNDRLPH